MQCSIKGKLAIWRQFTTFFHVVPTAANDKCIGRLQIIRVIEENKTYQKT